MTPQRPIGPRRRLFQAAACLSAFLLPFGSVHGESLLRIDLSRGAVVVLGRALYVEEFFLLLLAGLALLFLFLLLTLMLGRVWCGWACPQTILTELVERFAGRGRPLRLHAAALAAGVTAGVNVVWYFLPPREFLSRLAAGELPPAAVVGWALLGTATYVNLAFVRRSFCAVCPYARIQTALTEPGTLALGVLPSETARCLECGACARACPIGMDIRSGDEAGCVQCAACLDACRNVFSARRERAVLGYTFGKEGIRGLLSPRSALLAFAVLASTAVLGLALEGRRPISLAVRRASATVRPVADGRSAVFYTAHVGSRGAARVTLRLSARSEDGAPLEMRTSSTTLELGPGERRALDFALLLPAGSSPRAAVICLTGPEGEAAALAPVALPVPSSERRR